MSITTLIAFCRPSIAYLLFVLHHNVDSISKYPTLRFRLSYILTVFELQKDLRFIAEKVRVESEIVFAYVKPSLTSQSIGVISARVV
jgi:hypothetical protein